MTDLEMTLLCAEAMGYDNASGDTVSEFGCRIYMTWTYYNPLHDDAQAMALVKKLRIGISPYFKGDVWCISTLEIDVDSTDLNRAIVECVAKMQAAKK